MADREDAPPQRAPHTQGQPQQSRRPPQQLWQPPLETDDGNDASFTSNRNELDVPRVSDTGNAGGNSLAGAQTQSHSNAGGNSMQVDTVDGQMDANQPPPAQTRGDIVSEAAFLVQCVQMLEPSSRQAQLKNDSQQLLQEWRIVRRSP